MTLIRGEAIPDGFYHLVSDIIVKHVDGTYLLMQRDIRKNYGGMWEATAGGSALKGEGPLACATTGYPSGRRNISVQVGGKR